jgi:hypothetical protein
MTKQAMGDLVDQCDGLGSGHPPARSGRRPGWPVVLHARRARLAARLQAKR